MEGQFNARISRLERMQDSETEIPNPTAADAGKVVTVNQDGDGYVLGEGGGGGLPAYSSSDIGKVLTVGEGSSSTTEVIVPEQTVTVGAPLPKAILTTDYDISALHNDDLATLTINGTSSVLSWDSEVSGFFGEDYSITIESGVWTLNDLGSFGPGASITVSLTRSIPNAEPKWEAPEGGGGGVFRVDMLYDEETYSLRSSKTSTEIISAFNSGLLPYLFDSDENAIYPLTFINNIINIADFTLVSMLADGTSQTISRIAVNKYTVDATGSIQVVSGQKVF